MEKTAQLLSAPLDQTPCGVTWMSQSTPKISTSKAHPRTRSLATWLPTKTQTRRRGTPHVPLEHPTTHPPLTARTQSLPPNPTRRNPPKSLDNSAKNLPPSLAASNPIPYKKPKPHPHPNTRSTTVQNPKRQFGKIKTSHISAKNIYAGQKKS